MFIHGRIKSIAVYSQKGKREWRKLSIVKKHDEKTYTHKLNENKHIIIKDPLLKKVRFPQLVSKPAGSARTLLAKRSNISSNLNSPT